MEIVSLGNVLITGGTGTFGKALSWFLLENESIKINYLTIFSRDEDKQFHMAEEFRKHKNRINFIIGDVRNYLSLKRAFNLIDVVFHAAALKHVPVGERFPNEIIETNVLGTRNILDAAEETGVSRVVNLSSDKAVQPVNAYGMSKGLSEKLVAAFRSNVGTVAVNLRYGNVIGSRGSVIPLFLSQIKKGVPLTVTNGNMTRYMLEIEKAIRLAIVCASNDIDSGSVCVIKSPAATIGSIVEAFYLYEFYRMRNPSYNDLLKEESSFVREIGIRPGEKMHETLLTKEEVLKSVLCESNGIDYYKVTSNEVSGLDFSLAEEFTSENTKRLTTEEVFSLLINLGFF